MRLEKIPADVFAEFIESRFGKSGIRAEPGLGAAIVDLAGNLPYDVQRLAHETWDDVRDAGGRRADARPPARHARAPARRAGHDVRGGLAAADAGAARGPARRRAAGRTRAAVGRHPRRAIGSAARRASRRRWPRSSSRTCSSSEGSRYVVVDSLLREWVARKTF